MRDFGTPRVVKWALNAARSALTFTVCFGVGLLKGIAIGIPPRLTQAGS